MDHLEHQTSDGANTDPAVQALVVLGAVMGALKEDWAWCSEAARPPEHLVLAIRAAPGPVLRGLLVEVVEEVGRRQCRGGIEGMPGEKSC